MQRLCDWPARLHAFIDQVKRSSHRYGTQDCLVGFAFGAVTALTGEDPAALYRGRYDTAKGALRVMREAGHANLADLVASHLPEIHVSRARLGDLAAIPDGSPFGFALGIVNGERLLVMREDGLGTTDFTAATRAFRVG
ncbi:hypothetical protein [Aurantimonas sp. 22II-16-19i]|uniref:DUF6950 family protein n=1 Tax=Aurantimonas sp. 22II-16-19i TaxID=1317114 RepID=UPI0009F7B4DC|nr:hypothetical protein [Aurantimonas sp. 22II-16-19i]ORE89738.1 hypothetical protein ATO4_23707 [Aurantimonas sp. 22II-16-19i]